VAPDFDAPGQDGVEGDHAPVCVGGRGAAPPEYCGGPTGYRLMLKRRREGAARATTCVSTLPQAVQERRIC